jgi:hypothetical protein
MSEQTRRARLDDLFERRDQIMLAVRRQWNAKAE